MPILECKNCIPVNIPDNWKMEQKNEIANFVRKFGKIKAIQSFHRIGMGLKNTKNITFHITRENGSCHNCGETLLEWEGQCPKCKRLNLDW